MKILIVQESDWIKRGPHNSHHLFERLSEKGHEVRVIDYEINWSDDHDHELLSKRIEIKNFHKVRDNARITVIRPSILYVMPLYYMSLLYTHKKEIKRQIREFKPDIIIGLGILNTYLAIQECNKSNIPFVYFVLDTLHTLVREHIFQALAKQLEQYNYRHADLIISVNRLLRDYTIEMRADKDKAMVLPHGIELSKFMDSVQERDHIRAKYGFKEGDVVLFFMGYLYDFSGLVAVATSLKEHISQHPYLKLFIVGEGPIYDQLCRIQEKIPENMVVLNWQPYGDIPKIVSAADICILPSEVNATMKYIVPIKIIEYMAAGKPVITTELPGVIKEFSNGNGVICVSKPELVISKTIDIIKKDRVADEGLKARKYSENFEWDKLTDILETKLESMVAKADH